MTITLKTSEDIKRHREKLGLTQQEYGDLLAIPRTTIMTWETKSKPPRYLEAYVIDRLKKARLLRE